MSRPDFYSVPVRMLDAIHRAEDAMGDRAEDLWEPKEKTDILSRLDGWWEWFTRVYGEPPKYSGSPRRRLYVDRETMTEIHIAASNRSDRSIRFEDRGSETPMLIYKGIEIVFHERIVGIRPAELVEE